MTTCEVIDAGLFDLLVFNPCFIRVDPWLTGCSFRLPSPLPDFSPQLNGGFDALHSRQSDPSVAVRLRGGVADGGRLRRRSTRRRRQSEGRALRLEPPGHARPGGGAEETGGEATDRAVARPREAARRAHEW